MSKKSRKRAGKAAEGGTATRSGNARGRGRRGLVVSVVAACALLAASYAATRFEPVRRAAGLRPLVATPAQGVAQLPLSKGLTPADHFAELRTNLNPALGALGIGVVPGDDSIASNLPYLQDVRDRLR